jgi:hypothetical protein
MVGHDCRSMVSQDFSVSKLGGQVVSTGSGHGRLVDGSDGSIGVGDQTKESLRTGRGNSHTGSENQKLHVDQ